MDSRYIGVVGTHSRFTLLYRDMGSGTSKHTTSSRPTIDDSKKRHSQLAPSFSPSPLTALSTGGDLSLPNISSWEDNASSDPRTRLARILCQTQINTALTLCSVRAVNTHIFNTELGFTTGPVTNQKNSGRCWLFAACNILRYQIMKTLKLSMFELSQVVIFLLPVFRLIVVLFPCSRIYFSMTN